MITNASIVLHVASHRDHEGLTVLSMQPGEYEVTTPPDADRSFTRLRVFSGQLTVTAGTDEHRVSERDSIDLSSVGRVELSTDRFTQAELLETRSSPVATDHHDEAPLGDPRDQIDWVLARSKPRPPPPPRRFDRAPTQPSAFLIVG